MKVITPLLTLWPGATGSVRYGLWDHVGLALAFNVAASTCVYLNFSWSDYLIGYVRLFLWLGLGLVWLVLSATAHTRLKAYESTLASDSSGSAFLEAQTHYLHGNWFETECCLNLILKKNPYDAEALLMLATLFRHLQRFDQARATLARLEKLDASEYWHFEISQEREAIVEDEEEAREEEQESSGQVSDASTGLDSQTCDATHADHVESVASGMDTTARAA
ncbi:MAG: hypothetical protein Q4G03_08595 [Planctomycetia bacterium]|nr:hypothetical protein [Planctomycetia bacterium]